MRTGKKVKTITAPVRRVRRAGESDPKSIPVKLPDKKKVPQPVESFRVIPWALMWKMSYLVKDETRPIFASVTS